MSASDSSSSESVEEKNDSKELKKSTCVSPTSFAGPSSRKDEEKPPRGSEGKAKFDVEQLKKIQISFSYKKRQPRVNDGDETFDPSLITPVRRPGEGSLPIFSRVSTAEHEDGSSHRVPLKRKRALQSESDLLINSNSSSSPEQSEELFELKKRHLELQIDLAREQLHQERTLYLMERDFIVEKRTLELETLRRALRPPVLPIAPQPRGANVMTSRARGPF